MAEREADLDDWLEPDDRGRWGASEIEEEKGPPPDWWNVPGAGANVQNNWFFYAGEDREDLPQTHHAERWQYEESSETLWILQVTQNQ